MEDPPYFRSGGSSLFSRHLVKRKLGLRSMILITFTCRILLILMEDPPYFHLGRYLGLRPLILLIYIIM